MTAYAHPKHYVKKSNHSHGAFPSVQQWLPLLRQVYSIAVVTFQELLREKILWSSFVFAILFLGLAYAVSRLSFADNARIALDFGLTSVSIVGGLMAVIMGATLIAKEVQNRTLYLVLTKISYRWQFVVGKFLGLMALIFLNTALMLTVLFIVYFISGGKPEMALVKSLMLQFMEFGVLASIACIFSAFSTSVLAAVFTSGIWVIGHAMDDVHIVASKMENHFSRFILNWASRILPDLTKFDIKAQVSHGLPIAWHYVDTAIFYGLAYMAFALVASCLVFSRRDL